MDMIDYMSNKQYSLVLCMLMTGNTHCYKLCNLCTANPVPWSTQQICTALKGMILYRGCT